MKTSATFRIWFLLIMLFAATYTSIFPKNLPAVPGDENAIQRVTLDTHHLTGNSKEIWSKATVVGSIITANDYTIKLGLSRNSGEFIDNDVWFCGYVKFPAELILSKKRYALTVCGKHRIADPFFVDVFPNLAKRPAPLCFRIVCTVNDAVPFLKDPVIMTDLLGTSDYEIVISDVKF